MNFLKLYDKIMTIFGKTYEDLRKIVYEDLKKFWKPGLADKVSGIYLMGKPATEITRLTGQKLKLARQSKTSDSAGGPVLSPGESVWVYAAV